MLKNICAVPKDYKNYKKKGLLAKPKVPKKYKEALGILESS
ncbi:MAG: hypothetical protein PUB35_03350 [Campylobacteraceae bacterium]|nr:hypothetical protein [Campylobacteraceae bacterium]